MPKGQRLAVEEITNLRTLRAGGMSIVDIALQTGFSKKAVGHHTAGAVTNRPTDSGRDRLLRVIAEAGPF